MEKYKCMNIWLDGEKYECINTPLDGEEYECINPPLDGEKYECVSIWLDGDQCHQFLQQLISRTHSLFKICKVVMRLSGTGSRMEYMTFLQRARLSISIGS